MVISLTCILHMVLAQDLTAHSIHKYRGWTVPRCVSLPTFLPPFISYTSYVSFHPLSHALTPSAIQQCSDYVKDFLPTCFLLFSSWLNRKLSFSFVGDEKYIWPESGSQITSRFLLLTKLSVILKVQHDPAIYTHSPESQLYPLCIKRTVTGK